MVSHKRPERILPAVGVVTLLALASACGGGPDGEAGGGPKAAAATSSVAVGEPAPDFELPDLDGNPVSLSDYDGQVRLIDFWATWCAPCREEVPMFKEFQQEYGPEGFTLLAISMDDDDALVEEFVAEHAIPYPNLMGNAEVEQTFGPIVGYPMAFLLDRDGTVVKTFVGAKPRKILEEEILKLLRPEA
jgi:thiol-disulfide isomerase/thioredoxin